MKQRGVFIVIEGSDGSGKSTQFELLKHQLEQSSLSYTSMHFPRHGEPSAYFVERYLNGDYGGNDDVGPYKGSLFYALDRFAASFQIRAALDEGKIVVCDRYVGSNMAHQGSKIDDPAARKEYFGWVDNIEFTMLGIPRPDLNIVLHMPADIAQSLVAKKTIKDDRSYLKNGKTHDIHEADSEHLKKTEQVYVQMCGQFPDVFTKVDCAPGGELLSVQSIADEVWRRVQQLLT